MGVDGLRVKYAGTRTPISETRACRRCGAELKDARPSTTKCKSCHSVESYETWCAAHGIDLALLADDEFVEGRRIGGVYQPVIVRDAA